MKMQGIRYIHITKICQHNQTKYEGMKYVCDQCIDSFSPLGHLAIHKKYKHDCNQCHNNFF